MDENLLNPFQIHLNYRWCQWNEGLHTHLFIFTYVINFSNINLRFNGRTCGLTVQHQLRKVSSTVVVEGWLNLIYPRMCRRFTGPTCRRLITSQGRSSWDYYSSWQSTTPLTHSRGLISIGPSLPHWGRVVRKSGPKCVIQILTY